MKRKKDYSHSFQNKIDEKKQFNRIQIELPFLFITTDFEKLRYISYFPIPLSAIGLFYQSLIRTKL